MCELLALSSSKPTTVNLSIERLARHGAEDSVNKDGWGIVYYSEGDVRRFRDTGPAAESALVKFVEQQPLCSTRMMAHIRAANVGSNCLSNTHPFIRELGGKVHSFAHNGYLENIQAKPAFGLNRFRLLGDTDSEWAFCALLDRLSDLWMSGSDVPGLAQRLAIITEFADEIRQLGLSNFIYCDDDAIFAHADRRRQPDGEFRAPGLWVHQQTCPRNGARLDGGGISIDSPQQEIAMVASVPMTGDHWQPLEAGTLLVLKEGKVVNRSDT